MKGRLFALVALGAAVMIGSSGCTTVSRGLGKITANKYAKPRSGTVWTVALAPGAQVAEGDEILVLESMKMEIPVPAPAPGVVAELLVAPGEAVAEGQVLARIDR